MTDVPQSEPAIPEPNRASVLEFRNVTVRQAGYHVEMLHDLTFCLRESELMLIRLEEGREHLPVAAAALGLITPREGEVLFQGEDWQLQTPEANEHRRAQIGRVFAEPRWISNLTILENVLLSRRHHTTVPDQEILENAQDWARRFGLSEIPPIRAALVPADEERRAEWVRAFHGRPKLLLLERPMYTAPGEYLAPLISAVRAACAAGAAVLWESTQTRVWTHPDLDWARRFSIEGARLRPFEELQS